jgi:Tol biopolymer transport system component
LQVLGGSLRRLANAVTATWSPDGQSIAYATANGDICLMRHDGADAHRIASPGGYIKSIAWSPSGNILRFSKEGILWEMTSTGSNLHQFPARMGNIADTMEWAMGSRWTILFCCQWADLDSR